MRSKKHTIPSVENAFTIINREESRSKDVLGRKIIAAVARDQRNQRRLFCFLGPEEVDVRFGCRVTSRKWLVVPINDAFALVNNSSNPLLKGFEDRLAQIGKNGFGTLLNSSSSGSYYAGHQALCKLAQEYME